MKMKLNQAALLLAGLFVAAQSPATPIFDDNFNAYNGGVGVLNFSTFGGNWTISNGTVDLIGNGYFDLHPGNGLYIDLDGSTGAAGKMVSKPIALGAGSYELSFGLGGSRRNNDNEVSVSVDVGIASTSYTVLSAAPFVTQTMVFTLLAPQNINLVFKNAGGDNVGAILDNVKLNAVPDGGLTAGLLGMAFLGLAVCRRKAGQ